MVHKKIPGKLLILLLILGCSESVSQRFIREIDPPENYEREEAPESSFAHYLSSLPLKDTKTVLLYNGKKKWNQFAQYAVVDMDIGNRDLQQCADAVMRLRGEYLYGQGRTEDIHFNFTNGDKVTFDKYAAGYRPRVQGNTVSWSQSAAADKSYPTFRKYMDLIFAYAGSYSLSGELKKVTDPDAIQIGDVFIQGGFPGHAILVVDLAIHMTTGQKVFLLAQSYMPAQDIHILKNPSNANLSPWYELHPEKDLVTPEWTFQPSDLKRFE